MKTGFPHYIMIFPFMIENQQLCYASRYIRLISHIFYRKI
uniref:Uncharacterized protein n=1 Tax=uncultured Desulfobacterium sp. TaxID=201089 RepID=E1YG31_9BACT|nr:unknown protein [uncultured Desulfobacterium sp.]